MEKSSYEKTSFALARRIVLLFFFLVFVPLAILAGLLFREEYVLKQREKKTALMSMMEEHQIVADEEIDKQKQFLNGLFFTSKTYLGKKNFLKNWAAKRGSVEIFHLKKNKEGQYVSDLTSVSYMQGKDRKYVLEFAESGRFFGVIMSNHKKRITFIKRGDNGDFWAETYVFNTWASFLHPRPGTLLDYKVLITFMDKAPEKNQQQTEEFKKMQFEGRMYEVSKQSFAFLPFKACYLLPKSFGATALPAFYNQLSIIIAILVGVGVVLLLFILPVFTKPFRQLFKIMHEAGKGDLKVRFEPSRFGFEVNEVGASFNEMVSNLTYYIETEKQQRAHKELLKKELELGQRVQKNMLGQPSRNSYFDAQVFFRSAKEVGGDFFDFYPLDDAMHKVLFLVADTSGKGLDACLFSLSMRSILRSFSKSGLSLSQLAKRANEVYLQDSEDSQMFITAWLGIFDTKTKILEYCNLGHNPPLLAANGKPTLTLDPTGIAFGIDAYSKVKTEKVQINTGEKLLLYTDGITEAFNEQGQQFGGGRLEELFEKSRTGSSSQILRAVTDDLIRFCGKAPISDDQTLIVLEFN